MYFADFADRSASLPSSFTVSAVLSLAGTTEGHLGLLVADVAAGTLTVGPVVFLHRPTAAALSSAAARSADAVFDSLVALNADADPGADERGKPRSHRHGGATTSSGGSGAGAGVGRTAESLTDAITGLAVADITDAASALELVVATASGVIQVLSLSPQTAFVATVEADARVTAAAETNSADAVSAAAAATACGSASVLAIAPTSVLWHRALNDRVTNVAVGCLYARERHDILVTTFSGKLLLFSTDADSSVASLREAAKVALAAAKAKTKAKMASDLAAGELRGSGGGIGFGMMTRAEEAEWMDQYCFDTLRSDIGSLKQMIAEKREQFARANEAGLVAFNTPLNLRATLTLNADAGVHVLAVESELVLDSLYIYSTASVSCTPTTTAPEMLLSHTPVPTQGGGSGAAVGGAGAAGAAGGGNAAGGGGSSSSAGGGNAAPQLLLTVKLAPNTQRFEAHVRTLERAGAAGELTVMVMPKMEPKRSQRFTFPVLPLSLHAPLADPATGEPVTGLAAASNGASASANAGASAGVSTSAVLLAPAVEARFTTGRVNVLSVTGATLSTTLTHRWLRGLLPGLPATPVFVDTAAAALVDGRKPIAMLPPATPLSVAGLVDPACAFYQATDVPTVLGVIYGAGKAVFVRYAYNILNKNLSCLSCFNHNPLN